MKKAQPTDDADRRFMRMYNLQKIVGIKAFQELQKGARYHIWNRSSPPNEWVDDYNNGHLWHSEPRKAAPDMDMFEEVWRSTEMVCMGPFRHLWEGSGRYEPEKISYVLKPEYRKDS